MTAKVKKTVQEVKKKLQRVPSRTYTIAGVLVFAAISTILLVSSHAATPTASYEAETGTRNGNVATVADTGASSSSAVKFGMASTGSCATPDRVTVTTANKATYPAYPIGTKVWTQDGPDPWGGCFPGPNNTGVPAGTQLTAYTGSCTITTANVVIDKKTVNCEPLDIRAKGIVITNSHINGRVYVDDTRCSTASFTITDSTIVLNDLTVRGMMYCSYVATRVDVSGGGSMATCRSCTIQDSYLHTPTEDTVGHNHMSTVRIGEYANLTHNTFLCDRPTRDNHDGSGDTAGCSANQTGYSHDGIPPYNSTMKRNFYAGISDGYCAYGGSTGPPGDGQVHDVKFIENIFQRGTSAAYNWSPTSYICGPYGPVTSLDLGRPGNEFTGNTWDNGKPVSTVQNTWAANPSNPAGDPCYGAPANCTW